MARLIPSQIDAKTGSEELFLEELRRQLPDDCEVYHSLQFRTREKRAAEGECDVVILSPTLGLMVIEVKGGIVTYEDGRWRVSSGSGTRVVHPVDQCMKALGFFRAKLAQAFRNGVPVKLSYAIATPYTTFGGADLHGHEQVLIDGSHLGRLYARLAEIAGADGRPAVVDERAFGVLRTMLNPIFEVGAALGMTMLKQEAELLRLTTEQALGWTQFRGGETRALVSGPAGTGKTVLALSHALGMARAGQRTLLVCFNRALKSQLQEKARLHAPELGPEQLQVHTVDSLAFALCEEAGCKQPRSQHHARHVAARLRGVHKVFDQIVVDEGQDVDPDSWAMLRSLLGPKEHLVVFYDPRQELFTKDAGNARALREIFREEGPFSTYARVELTRNVRNAEPIVHFLRKSGVPYSHDTECRVKDPGVLSIDPRRAAELTVLHDLVSRLVNREGLTPEQLVVLTLKDATSCAVGQTRIGGVPVVREALPVEGALRVCSVGKFKGLESDVVIVVDADKKDPAFRRAWEYVAISRGKHRVFVVGAS